MQKHFKSMPKICNGYLESLSDTEIEVRQSLDKPEGEAFVRDVKKFSAAHGSRKHGFKYSSPFCALKIRDEMKIDLQQHESSSQSSVRSFKIYPIEEASENASQASSKMRLQQIQKCEEIRRIVHENKSKSALRPKSRKPTKQRLRLHHTDELLNHPEPMQQISSPQHDDHKKLLSKPMCQSLESLRRTKFPLQLEDALVLQRSKSPSESTESFKFSYLSRYSNDIIELNRRGKMNCSTDSLHDLLSVSSYPMSSSKSTSFLACITKPLASLCQRKPKKS